MAVKERVELVAGAIAAGVLGARAERRDFGGQQLRDFDLRFPDGHVEPLEVTRHFDQAATETWERLERADREAPTLARAWTLDIPSRQQTAGGKIEAYGVREFLRDAEPALHQLEAAGYERFDFGAGARDPSVAAACDTLLRLGVQFGVSHRVPPGTPGRISAVASVGGITDPNRVAEAIEAEAADAGNQTKLREPVSAPRRHLFVVFDPSSGSAFNAVDRGMLGRLPVLPASITTVWAFARHRVFVTSPPERWHEHAVPDDVVERPESWHAR